MRGSECLLYWIGITSAVEKNKEDNGVHRRKEKEKKIQESGVGILN